MTPAVIVRAVTVCSRHAWLVIGVFALLTTGACLYTVRNFQITTDSSKLLSASLPWRQQEIALNKAFPQRTDQIIAGRRIEGSGPAWIARLVDALKRSRQAAAEREVRRFFDDGEGGTVSPRGGTRNPFV